MPKGEPVAGFDELGFQNIQRQPAILEVTFETFGTAIVDGDPARPLQAELHLVLGEGHPLHDFGHLQRIGRQPGLPATGAREIDKMGSGIPEDLALDFHDGHLTTGVERKEVLRFVSIPLPVDPYIFVVHTQY